MSDQVALSDTVHSPAQSKRLRSVEYLFIGFFILLVLVPFLKYADHPSITDALIGKAISKEKAALSTHNPSQAFKLTCAPIPVDQLKRDADILIHKRIVIQGKALEVLRQGQEMVLRVMATDTRTNGQVVVLADASQSIGDGDMVTVWGTVTGSNSRQPQSLWTIAAPSIKAAYIEK